MDSNTSSNGIPRGAQLLGLAAFALVAVALVVFLIQRSVGTTTIAQSSAELVPTEENGVVPTPATNSSDDAAQTESSTSRQAASASSDDVDGEEVSTDQAEESPDRDEDREDDPSYVPSNPEAASSSFGPNPNDAASLLLDNDLLTGSREFSAVTVNEDDNVLLIADDEGRLFEFALNDDGAPVVPPLRTLRVAVGGGDVEGLAWMSGSTYALAHENDGRITVVDLDGVSDFVGSNNLVRTVDTGIRETDGNGLEGIAYVQPGDPAGDWEFVAVKERPPTLVLIDEDGTAETVPLTIPVTDVSGIWFGNGAFSAVSDESRSVITFTLDDDNAPVVSDVLDLADLDSADPDSTAAAGLFAQPEGVTRTSDGRLYVVGEAPGPGRFSFGLWRQ